MAEQIDAYYEPVYQKEKKNDTKIDKRIGKLKIENWGIACTSSTILVIVNYYVSVLLHQDKPCVRQWST